MGPPGAPEGHPKGGPHPTFTEIHLVWHQSIRFDAYSSFTPFIWIIDPRGGPGAPIKGALMAPTRLSPKQSKHALCGISRFVSMNILHLQHSLDNRPSPQGGPGAPTGHAKWGPRPTFTEIRFVWRQSIRFDAYSIHLRHSF